MREYLLENWVFLETLQAEKFPGHDDTTSADEDSFFYEIIDVIDDAETTEVTENKLPSKFNSCILK